ncbi:cardioactive peptide isoform X2 [Ixodes scapularis]|uniref:cardioactive peptide isoform X2 n=1 Tax=Ixodes scapularis TaxID=6945 RepID=UPI001161B997|nr:cardioactive peptide isoform X2 [Ixodes scapularis]
MKPDLSTVISSSLYILLLSACLSAALEKQDDTADDSYLVEQKRPFCNAFTGCGGKRSSPNRIDLLARLQNRLLSEIRNLELRTRLEEGPSRRHDEYTDNLRSNGLLMDLLTPSFRKRKFPMEGV